jgi:hypothetical protein
LIVASFGLLLFLNASFSEITYIGDGVGWDGRVYADIVGKLCNDPASVFYTTDSYYLQRLLPCGMVAIILKIFGLPCHDHNIIWAFRWHNFAVLTAAVYVWTLVSQRINFSLRAAWLSAAFLFLNFAVQKQYFYFPVNTDATALSLSVALFYCFLSNRRKTLMILAILGAICWPIILYTGIILLLWPYRPVSVQVTTRSAWAAVVTACAMGFSLYSFFYQGFWPRPLYRPAAVPLSALLTAFLLFFGFRNMIPPVPAAVRELFRPLKSPLLYAAVAVVFGLQSLFYFFADSSFKTLGEVGQISVQHLGVPGIAILGAIVYFGPVIFFAIYRWPEISRRVQEAGMAMLIVFSTGIVQLLFNSEARRGLVFFPFLVAYVTKAFDDRSLSRPVFVTSLILSFLFSKLWFLFNHLPGLSFHPLTFPLQVFMAHVGYMDVGAYIIYGAASLLILLGLPLYFPGLTKTKGPYQGDPVSE